MNTGMQQGAQMRFTDDELEIIRKTFGENEFLLKLLRKVFLPELDPKAPIGQMIDLWMTVDVKDKSPEEIAVALLARNEVIRHVDQRLIELSLLAKQAPLSEAQVKEKARKDSSK